MKPTSFLGFVMMLVLLCVCRTGAQTPAPRFDESKLAAVPERMKQFIKDHEIAGAVTLIATKDRVIQLEAVGQANIARDVPMRPDAIFAIASMTKPITSTAVLMLQDEGKLSIDDPVGKYVPELADLAGPDGKPAKVTLKHLLTHTSGMVLEAPADIRQHTLTLAGLVPVYARSPLRFAPGTKWEYCQAGMNSLGRVVEVVSHQSFPEFLRLRIFRPLGMRHTTFYPTPGEARQLATMYRREGDSLVAVDRPVTTSDHYPAANGGLYSTASDYGRFCQMLLNDGTLDRQEILKPQTVRMMRSLQSGELKTGFTPGDAWGLGVCVVVHPQGVTGMLSPGTFGHGGAYGTQAWIDPVKGVAYVLMVQRANFPNSDDSPVRKGFQEAAASAMQ